GKLLCTHFAGSHGKLTVLDCAGAADMALDRDIVGRVSEDHLRSLASHQRGDSFSVECAAADQPVCAELPEITESASHRSIVGWDDVLVRITWFFGFESFNQAVDLGNGEAGDADVEI